MHTPQLPKIPHRSFAWLKPILGLAVIIVSLLHAWEVIEETLKRSKGRD